ncbi:hypothetical protein DRJ54_00505 [Candidatus Acetothermia bacterium]|nr:MAG: hypothetical protein DRJ54_00505 [Candidatus Acetothermia bacterium]
MVVARISDKRLLEWWEMPGVDGRDAFDEEILYLNSLAEELPLPRWALAVRDLMPRWGFEPCSSLFPVGLEQVLTMIGQGRAHPRVGSCGELSLGTRLALQAWGETLLRWGRGRRLDGGAPDQLDPEQAEAMRAAGEAALAILSGHAALDDRLDRWTERARYPLTRALVEGDDAPLPLLFRHACTYNLNRNLDRIVAGIMDRTTPQVRVCQAALEEAAELDPARVTALRTAAAALARWREGKDPQGPGEAWVQSLLGERDPVRDWLAASLYKCLKLWLQHLDRLLGERHRYPSLM